MFVTDASDAADVCGCCRLVSRSSNAAAMRAAASLAARLFWVVASRLRVARVFVVLRRWAAWAKVPAALWVQSLAQCMPPQWGHGEGGGFLVFGGC